jgi:hypothetical protein
VAEQQQRPFRSHGPTLSVYTLSLGRVTVAVVAAAVLAGDVVLEPEYWRSRFADTGGVAPLGPNNTNGNFTITSGTGPRALDH